MSVAQCMSTPEVVASTSSLFIDDFSSFGCVYLMRYNFEAFEKLREFKNEVEKQFRKSIKTLRSDRGGEYLNIEFTQLLKDNSILAQLTIPYTL